MKEVYETLYFKDRENAVRAYAYLLVHYHPKYKSLPISFELKDKDTEPKIVFRVEVIPGPTEEEDEFDQMGLDLFQMFHLLFISKHFIWAHDEKQ